MQMGGFGGALLRYLQQPNDHSGPALPPQSAPAQRPGPARALAQIAPGPSQPQFQSLAQPPGPVTTQAQPRAGNQALGKLAAGFGGYVGFNSAGAQGFPGAFAGLQDRRARLDAPAFARQQRAISEGLEQHLSPQEQALFRAAPDVFLKNYGERFGRPDKVLQGEALFGPDSGGGVRALGGVSKPFAEGDSLYAHDPVSDQVDFLGQRAPSFAEEIAALGAQTNQFQAREQARHNRAGEGLAAAGLQMQEHELGLRALRGFQDGAQQRPLTEAQQKMKFALSRLEQAEPAFAAPEGGYYAPNKLIESVRAVPFIGPPLANAGSNNDSQILHQSSTDVSDAILRLFSGAGANKDEIALYRKIYTPLSSDRAETLEHKARLRQSLIEELQAGLANNRDFSERDVLAAGRRQIQRQQVPTPNPDSAAQALTDSEKRELEALRQQDQRDRANPSNSYGFRQAGQQ